MPNYVPEGEDNATAKREFGRHGRNYVPDPNAEPTQPSPGPDEAFAEALATRERRRKVAKDELWRAAKARMQLASTNHAAIGQLNDMSMSIREVHLLAEEYGANRKDVLSFFPPPGEKARALWAEYTDPQPEAPKRRPTSGRKAQTEE
jgi:hypothetical protein